MGALNSAHREGFVENREFSNQDLMTKVKQDGATFQHILLYNSLRVHKNARNALERIQTIHSQLLTLAMYLAGFQFMGLTFTTNGNEWGTMNMHKKVFTFCLCLGFFTSVFAILVSFIAMEYTNGMLDESDSLITFGILKFWNFFYLADLLVFLTCILFLTSVNLMCHDVLDQGLAYGLNGLCIIMCLFIVKMFKRIIPDAQEYENKSIVRYMYQNGPHTEMQTGEIGGAKAV